MPSTRSKSVADFPVGTTVRVVFEGTVETTGSIYGRTTHLRLRNGDVIAPSALGAAMHVHLGSPAMPTWQAGDVIVLRFTESGDRFTYARGVDGWVANQPLGEARVRNLWAKGLVEHVLRDGKPVATSAPKAAGGVVSASAPSLSPLPRPRSPRPGAYFGGPAPLTRPSFSPF